MYPPISLSLTNGGPCPDFRSGKGGREIENQGGSHTLLPVYTPAKQRSLCFSHTASSINMPHCPATSHCHATITANHHLPKVLTKSDAAKTSPSFATRDLPRQAREKDNLPKQGILSDPSFRPSGSLRFDPQPNPSCLVPPGVCMMESR